MKMVAENGVSIRSDKDLNIFTKQKLSLEAKELIKIFAKKEILLRGQRRNLHFICLGVQMVILILKQEKSDL